MGGRNKRISDAHRQASLVYAARKNKETVSNKVEGEYQHGGCPLTCTLTHTQEHTYTYARISYLSHTRLTKQFFFFEGGFILVHHCRGVGPQSLGSARSGSVYGEAEHCSRELVRRQRDSPPRGQRETHLQGSSTVTYLLPHSPTSLFLSPPSHAFR